MVNKAQHYTEYQLIKSMFIIFVPNVWSFGQNYIILNLEK